MARQQCGEALHAARTVRPSHCLRPRLLPCVPQDRPLFSIGDESWDDHTCDVWTHPEKGYTIVGYVPRL